MFSRGIEVEHLLKMSESCHSILWISCYRIFNFLSMFSVTCGLIGNIDLKWIAMHGSHKICFRLTISYYNSICLCLIDSILSINSDFSRQPLHSSSQSLKIFFNSRTLIFFKLIFFQSNSFSYANSQICLSFFFKSSHIFSTPLKNPSGFVISVSIEVAAISVPPI